MEEFNKVLDRLIVYCARFKSHQDVQDINDLSDRYRSVLTTMECLVNNKTVDDVRSCIFISTFPEKTEALKKCAENNKEELGNCATFVSDIEHSIRRDIAGFLYESKF